jgi:ribosome-binding protein aMBF1 (putative translation factor)
MSSTMSESESPPRPATARRFGEALKRERRRVGLSIFGLAAAAGVHPRSICRWQRGEVCPDLNILQKLARALGCGVAALAGQ